jgi:dihydropteroate synthase
MKPWQIRDRQLALDKTLIMGVLNVTPDSFSDGGRFLAPEDAIRQAEKLVDEGADILDIGGQSTRPGGKTAVGADQEMARVIPVIDAVAKRFEILISIDTTRSIVAESAVDAGASIINDISALRFDERISEVAATHGAGLVLMHSRGTFETMHSLEPVGDIFSEVSSDFRRAISTAGSHGVRKEQIVLDVGIGFGKSLDQNLELMAKLGKLKAEFPEFPFLVGASRKSFLGKLLRNASPDNRLLGSVAAAAVAAWNGASIVRVHDVKETKEVLAIVEAIRDQK